jgi:hypothetical protein
MKLTSSSLLSSKTIISFALLFTALLPADVVVVFLFAAVFVFVLVVTNFGEAEAEVEMEVVVLDEP